MEQTFDRPPDGGQELAALLERSGVDFVREGDRFRFRFAAGGCAWQMVCRCVEDRVLVYGVHPAPVLDEGGAAALCSRLNGRLAEGSLFLQEGHFIFRTSARLTEYFEAQERIAAALEYNAAVLSHWWEQLTAQAQGLAYQP